MDKTSIFRTIISQQEGASWDGIKANKASSDGQLLKGNNKYVAVSWDTGKAGSLCILKQEKRGIIPNEYPMIKGHTEPITDFDFLPFNDNYIATASGDCTIQLWNIPDDFNFSAKPESILFGHKKRVNLIEFNQTSEGILASSSQDSTLKVWDVINGNCVYSITGNDYPFSINWSFDGSLIGSIWRDKILRIADPRQQTFTHEVPAHEGGKNQKVQFMGNTDMLVTIGFSKSMGREYKVWDMKNMDKPILSQQIDTNHGILMPYYDSDLNLLWLLGKGDNFIKYYEWNGSNFVYYNNDFKSQIQSKGCCFLPKTCLNVRKTEIARCCKLTDKSIESISLLSSRKGDIFQEEFYPDCAYDVGQDANSWLSDNTTYCKTRSMRPEVEKPLPKALRDIQFTQMDMPEYYQGSISQGMRSSTVTNNNNNMKASQKQEESKDNSQELLNKIAMIEEQLAEQKQQNEELQAQNQSLQQELEEARQNSNTNQNNNNNDDHSSALRNEISELKNQLQQKEDELQNVNSAQVEQIEELRKQLGQSNDKLELLEYRSEKYKDFLNEFMEHNRTISEACKNQNTEDKMEHFMELDALLKIKIQSLEDLTEEVQQKFQDEAEQNQ